eukprot:6182759-Pleurochrysis_carterae.AAC.3
MPWGKLRRASAARAKLRLMAWAPSHMACHRFATRACGEGCKGSLITAAITVYDRRGCSQMVRLASAATALVFCPAAMTPMPFSASATPQNPSEICAWLAANATSVIVAVITIHLVVDFFDCLRPGVGFTA